MLFDFIIGLDRASLYFIQSFTNPILTILMQAISLLGNPIFWFLLAAYYYWKGKQRQAFFLMNLVVFSAILSNLVKGIVQRPRPSALEFKVMGDPLQMAIERDYTNVYSFPSGHTTLIASVFGYLFSIWNKKRIAILGIGVILVAISRMYLGMHFLSDVVVGIFFGVILGKINFVLEEKSVEGKIDIIHAKTMLIMGLVVVGLFILLYLGALALSFSLLGFYVGLVAWKKLALDIKYGNKKTQIVGFFGLFAIIALILAVKKLALMEEPFFFLAGLWISLINPLICQKF